MVAVGTVGKAATVRELETMVRACINRPRVHHALYSADPATFWVVCSSLDVVGDTTMAIDAYRALEEAGSYGERYLRLYGLLQAVYIQQDAVRHILESLKLRYDASGDLGFDSVREIRNQAIGHPTKQGRRPKQNIPQMSHMISRNTVSQSGFLLISTTEHGHAHSTDVSITDLIEKQGRGIAQRLRAVLGHLERAEEEHRMKYRDKKLAALFHNQIEYYVAKCYEGCRNDGEHGRLTLAQMHLELLSEVIASFRRSLTERGILPAYDHVELYLTDAEYPLSELRRFFVGGTDTTLDERSARIFVFFVQHQFRKLREYAEEFDRDYAEANTPADNFASA